MKTADGSLTIVDGKDATLNINGVESVIGGDNAKEYVTVNDIRYTLNEGAELTYDSEGNVTGIAKGTVTAELANAETSPVITLDGTTAFNFTATAEDGAFKMQFAGNSVSFISGDVTFSSNSISFPEGEVVLKLTNTLYSTIAGNITVNVPAGGVNVPIDSNIISADLADKVTFTFEGGLLTGSAYATGKISYDIGNKVVTLAKDAVFKADNLSIGSAIKTDFEFTALNDSTIAIEGSGLASSIVIKDGSAIHLSGTTFGLNGNLALNGGDLSFSLISLLNPSGVSDLTLTEGANLTFDLENIAPISITAPENSTAKISRADGVLSVTTDDDNGLNISVGGLNALKLNIQGTTQIDTSNKEITFTKDTVAKVELSSGSYIQFTANEDDASNIALTENGIALTPNENDGSLNFKFVNSNGNTVLNADLEVKNGTFIYNPNTNHLVLSGGTQLEITLGGYTFNLSNAEDVGGTFSIQNGLTFTPDDESGALTLSVANAEGTIYENVSFDIISGSVTLLSNGSISIAKDTEIKLDFDNDYSIAFKATDEVGGTVALTQAGLNYTPNEGDGTLELTVTKGDTSRTTTLEVTGTVTYNFGGSISLTEGTVVKNVFEDGNILTITANTELSGTLKFSPDGGLTITTTEPEALNIALSQDNFVIYTIPSIVGSVTYSTGVVTASDGTEMTIVDYDNYESKLKVEGGEFSAQFGSERTVYTAGEGATVTVDWQDDKTWVMHSGTVLIDNYDGNAVLSAGAVLESNDNELVTFILENAGTYTLNGEEFTTTKDNVAVKLANYNTVKFDADAGITYNGHTIDGKGTVEIVDGQIFFTMTEPGTLNLDNRIFNLTEEVPQGTTISLVENGFQVSRVLSAEEVEKHGWDESDVGKVFAEVVEVTNDDSYTVQLVSTGIDQIDGISNNAVVKTHATFDGTDDSNQFTISTDEVGTITLGDKVYKITGDENITFTSQYSPDGTSKLSSVSGLDEGGTISGNFNNIESVNEKAVTISGGADDVEVSELAGGVFIKGISDGESVSFESDNYLVSADKTMTVKDVTYSVENDADGVFISENEVLGLAENASLKVSESGTYTVNGTKLEVTADDVVIALNDSYAYIATGEQFNANATTAEILEGLGVEESEAVVVPTDASGDQRATLDNNGGVAVIEETETPVTIVGGTGDDTVVSKGENVLFNMAHGGDDKVIALDGNIKLENYDPRSNSGIQLTPDDMKAGVKFGDGIIELSNANVELTNNFVNLYDVAGNKELIGFATNEDKLVDASELTEGISIIGGGESSSNEVKKATLKGGSGDDSIIGGTGANINAGAGNNYIEVADNGGAAITYGGGNDTIENLNFADEKGADTIHNAAFTDVAVENGNVILTTDEGTITVNDAENKDIALDKDVTLQVGENIKYDGVANRYIATGENASVTVGENYSTEEKPVIALEEMEGNANNVDASEFEGAAEITGNSGDNVIAASKGGSTIDGGAGNDSMKGGDGADEFISSSGDDTISNFEFGTGKTADKLNAGENAVNKVKVDGDDIILVTENGTTKVENAAGQTMQFQNQHTNNSTIAAQFAKDTLSVNDDANFYWAAENNAVVAVGNDADSNTTVVVDLSNANYNDAEQLSFFGDIKEIDASEFEGAASLKGNDKNNIIKASKGGSTLNGGARNDKLIGGEGVDTFVYEQGNGKDTISNFEFGTGETADILDVDTNAIKKVKVYEDDVILEFAEGGALKIEDAAGKTIQLQSTNTGNETIAAQFGSGTISVNDDSKFYWAAGENATVELANSSADTISVDVSNANYNDAEQLSFYGDIRTVDATGYKGYANISGNDKNNVIIGGDYYNNLWGGDGAGNDTLIGGGEYNAFIYKKGNGNDIIKDETTGSSYVDFRGLTLDDIKSVTSTDSSIDIKFNDGGSVSIETSKKIGFTFERSAFTYTYNRETKEFESHEQGCY